MFIVRRVVGDSMLPDVKQGSIVIAKKTKSIIVGDIIVALQNNKEVIKRVNNVDSNGYFIVGSNLLNSSDSRMYGPVMKQDVIGKVVLKL